MRWFLAAIHVAATVPAYAVETFPRWDMAVFCEGRVAAGGEGDCVKVQGEYREKARRLWREADEEDRAECMAWLLNDDTPPSYFRLENCLSSKRRGM